MRFEWDSAKAAENIRKHGISFAEAMELFSDPEELMLADPEHSLEEQRFVSIARSNRGKLVLACYTETDDVIRLISARQPTSAEAELYFAKGDNYEG